MVTYSRKDIDRAMPHSVSPALTSILLLLVIYSNLQHPAQSSLPHCPIVLPLSAKTSSLNPRIIGGILAEASAVGYLAALFDSLGKFKCSATVISEQWLLTARHCRVTTEWTAAIATPQRDRGPSVPISEVHNNPNASKAADLALLRLVIPAPPRMQDLPALNENVSIPLSDSFARVIGYGRTHIGRMNNSYLRQVDVPIMGSDACHAAYGPPLVSGRICAGYSEGGCDSCLGDSGGPLVQYLGSKPVLIGVVNSGRDCAAPGFPGLYARIQMWLPWMRAVGASFQVAQSVDVRHPSAEKPVSLPQPSSQPSPRVSPQPSPSSPVTVTPTPSSKGTASSSSPSTTTMPSQSSKVTSIVTNSPKPSPISTLTTSDSSSVPTSSSKQSPSPVQMPTRPSPSLSSLDADINPETVDQDEEIAETSGPQNSRKLSALTIVGIVALASLVGLGFIGSFWVFVASRRQ